MERFWISVKVLDETDDSFITMEVEESSENLHMYSEGSLCTTRFGSVAVMLGVAGTQEEVLENARSYFRRICRWDQVPQASQVELGPVEHSEQAQSTSYDTELLASGAGASDLNDDTECRLMSDTPELEHTRNNEDDTQRSSSLGAPPCAAVAEESEDEDTNDEMLHFSQYSQHPDLY